MKRALKTIGIFLSAILLLASCSSDDESESIVGTWRSSYVSSDGYYMSMTYTFKDNGEYVSMTSYSGEGLPRMQLDTKGVYTFSGSSLSINEKTYDVYVEGEGGGSGRYDGNSEMNTWTYSTKLSGKTLVMSDYKNSNYYIGNITFKKD